MISAPAARASRHHRFASVDRNRHGYLCGELFDHRQHPATFFISRHGLRVGPRALAADVHQVRAIVHQPQRLINGGLRFQKSPTVGKAIGRDVHNSHQQRPLAARERAGSQSPGGGTVELNWNRHGFSVIEARPSWEGDAPRSQSW